jgi:hypothetical protein
MNELGVNQVSDQQVVERMRFWFAKNEHLLRRTPLGDAALAAYRYRKSFIMPEPATTAGTEHENTQ